MTESIPFHRVVWPLALAETIVWAAMFYSFPALLPVWERDLGWSKTELSGAFTAALIVSALGAPLAGWLIDRGYGRHAFVGGALFGALMLVLLSRVTAPWQFYCVWIGLGVAMSSTLYEACFAIIVLTMGSDAKRAITLVTLVAGFAGTVSFPSAHALTDMIGWRGTVVVFAAAVLVVAVPLVWIGCRVTEREEKTLAPAARPSTTQALSIARTGTFWLVTIAFAMIYLEYSMIMVHVLPILAGRGVHQEVAVLAASMIGPMQVAGRLAMMTAERRVSTRSISLGCFIAMGIAATSLLGAGVVPGLVVVFIIFHGAGLGVASIIKPIVTKDLLGQKNFGIISGMLAVPCVGASAVAPTVAAMLWEFGGYDLVILVALATVGLGVSALAMAWRSASTESGDD